MKLYNTGFGILPLTTVAAIASISLVAPFPIVEIEHYAVQLSLITGLARWQTPWQIAIPYICMSLTLILGSCIQHRGWRFLLLEIALLLYLITGILYEGFANEWSQWFCICSIGLSGGIIISQAFAWIAHNYLDTRRLQQLGICCGVACTGLIVALISVTVYPHFPICIGSIIPLCFSQFLLKKYFKYNQIPPELKLKIYDRIVEQKWEHVFSEMLFQIRMTTPHFVRGMKRVIGITILYFLVVFSTLSIVYYLPYRMEYFQLNALEMILVYCLLLLGVILMSINIISTEKLLRTNTLSISFLVMLIGYTILCNADRFPAFLIACYLIGNGIGVVHPTLCNKAMQLSLLHGNVLHLCIMFIGGLIALAIAPYLDLLARSIIDAPIIQLYGISIFPYMISSILLACLTIFSSLRPHDFVFRR